MPRSAVPACSRPRRSAFRIRNGTSGRCCWSSAIDGSDVCETEIRDFLSKEVAKWWLPDAIEFVDELPHTATGKLSKKDLRDKYRDYRFAMPRRWSGRD